MENEQIQTIESRLSALESVPRLRFFTDREMLGIMAAIVWAGWEAPLKAHEAYIEARRLLEIVDHNLREERQAEHDKQKAQKKLQQKRRPRTKSRPKGQRKAR